MKLCSVTRQRVKKIERQVARDSGAVAVVLFDNARRQSTLKAKSVDFEGLTESENVDNWSDKSISGRPRVLPKNGFPIWVSGIIQR